MPTTSWTLDQKKWPIFVSTISLQKRHIFITPCTKEHVVQSISKQTLETSSSPGFVYAKDHSLQMCIKSPMQMPPGYIDISPLSEMTVQKFRIMSALVWKYLGRWAFQEELRPLQGKHYQFMQGLFGIIQNTNAVKCDPQLIGRMTLGIFSNSLSHTTSCHIPH